jgi:hypothetical protein
MLRDARHAGLRLCFVRVQRRPEGGRAPYQSRALQQYVSRLRAYLAQGGAGFVDDTGDPVQQLSWYEDGDHLSGDGRRRYTELFVSRLGLRMP